MFEDVDEQQARAEILRAVQAYYHRFKASENALASTDCADHTSPTTDCIDCASQTAGQTNRISSSTEHIDYAGRVFDETEMEYLVDASLDFWLTAGRYTNRFEKELGAYLGMPYVSAVNSGSSANLLAFMTLTCPELGERAIKRGDEVITVACGFPTTVSPILQFGTVPVFVDVTVGQYNIDANALEEALSHKTKAVMLAHTLGNPFDIGQVQSFCRAHNLWLIEDNCDALGSPCCVDGEMRFTGTIGDIGTSSFYPPHHITMGEGGAVYTANPLLHKLIRSLRDWGRDCSCPSGEDGTCGHRFDGQRGLLPAGYDHKYTYSHFGYNLKVTDLQAAIGCAQLEKLPAFKTARQANHAYLRHALTDLQDAFVLPDPLTHSDPSWFGFALTCKDTLDRRIVISHLEQAGIQTRMLFAGNLLRHPCFDTLRNNQTSYRCVGNLPATDTIMENTFWVGVYPGMTEEKLERIATEIRRSVGKARRV